MLHLRLSALVLCAAILSGATVKADDPPATRNAIFNGDFLDGKAGWTIGGPRDLEVVARPRMVAHRSDAELWVRHGHLEQGFTIFSPYAIGVKPGQTYTLSLTIAGEGDVAFGVYEYGPGDKNTVFPLSDRLDLKPEPQTFTFTFTYQASEQAVTIRPRIVFFGTASASTGADSAPGRGGGSGKLDVRLMSFRLPLPEAEFQATTHWPEWAVSGALQSYQGMSAAEVRQIRKAVAVPGVLPPYQPLRRDGARGLRLTTSQFSFAHSALPDRISILGRPVLAEKMTLTLETGAGKSLQGATGSPLVTVDDQQAVVRQTVRGPDWTLSLKSTLTYDALLICDVDLQANRPLELTRASLALPLAEEVAQLIRYNHDSGDRWYFGQGPIPAVGEGVEVRLKIGRAGVMNDWQPRVLTEPRGTLWEWRRGVPRYFWIGDEERGVGWITESDQGWSNEAQDVTWSLERQPGALVSRLNFITRPTIVQGSWRVRFILQAMPPKPVRPDWFKLRFNRFWNWLPGDAKMIERLEAMRQAPPPAPADDPPAVVRYAQVGRGTDAIRPPWESLKGRGLPDIGFLWWDVWSVGCGSPQVAKPDVMKAYLRAGSYVGHMVLPYFAPTHLAVGDLNGYHYAARTSAWARLPQTGNTSLYVKICPNSFASEYQAYEIGRLIDEYGIEGVYFDNTHPESCANRVHGCGWVDAAGVTHPTTPFLGMRRLFMMIRQQFVKRGKTPFIMKHAGAFPGSVSFTDAQLDGEGTYGYDHTAMFTPAEFRSFYIGPNQFGVVQVYLPQFSSGTDTTKVSAAQQVIQGTRPLLAFALLHGTPVYCGAINSQPVFAAWGVLDELRGPTVDFIGYWKWPVNQTLNPRGLYASLYRQPERSVLVVSNLSAKDAGVELPRSELARLIPGLRSAADHMDRWPVQLDEKSLRLNVPAKSFRLISLQ
jgi:hypothetical protein